MDLSFSMMKKIFAVIIMVLLFSSFSFAKLLTQQTEISDGNDKYTINYFANTNTDPKRSFDPVETENFRKDLISKAKSYADSKMSSVSTWPDEGKTNDDGEQDKSRGLFGIFWLMVTGKKDEAKVALRDNIKQTAKNSFKKARLNVIVGTTPDVLATAVGQKDIEEHMYFLINDYKVTQSGLGLFDSPTITVTITDYDTFYDITSGKLNPKDALKSGKLAFSGSGVGRMKSLIVKWVSKY